MTENPSLGRLRSATALGSRALPGSPAHGRRWSIGLFATALALRILFIFVFNVYPGVPVERQVDPETIHLARSLLTIGRFSSPYLSHEPAPTALRAPLPALLFAAILAAVGDHTASFHGALYVIYSLVSALTVVLVYRIASTCLPQHVGKLAGILAALYPPSIYYATYAECDATLVSASLAAIVTGAIHLCRWPSWSRSVLLGHLVGIGALINPSTLSVAAGMTVWWVTATRGPLPNRLIRLGVVGTVAFLVVAPWLVRNRIVFNEWVFVRSNFGMEFRAGNRDDGRAFIGQENFHMAKPEEVHLLRILGEPEYDRNCTSRALDWIQRHPNRFCYTTARRIAYFWGKEVFFGDFPVVSILTIAIPMMLGFSGLLLALRRGVAVMPILIPLLLYPLPYYITHTQARFRFPIDAFLIILGAYALSTVWRKFRNARNADYSSSQFGSAP